MKYHKTSWTWYHTVAWRCFRICNWPRSFIVSSHLLVSGFFIGIIMTYEMLQSSHWKAFILLPCLIVLITLKLCLLKRFWIWRHRMVELWPWLVPISFNTVKWVSIFLSSHLLHLMNLLRLSLLTCIFWPIACQIEH